MANIGYATLTIMPSLKGTQAKLGEQLGGPVAAAGDKAGKSLGGRLVGGVGKVLKVGALAVGAAAGGILGTALFKGFKRLDSIDQARKKMEGLGHSTKAVDAIMENALASVKGTAFGLGDAAGLASTLVAAGIKPGQHLEKTLKRVADSATTAGTDLADMGLIWGKAAAKGKIDGQIVNQMLERQIPILDILGQHYGKTAAEVSDMVTKGKVSFEDFADAMDSKLGGAALKSGETFQGAFANMQAALGRLGAKMLEGVFPQMKGVFGDMTTALDGLAPVAEKVGAALGKAFAWGYEHLSKFIALFTLFTTGNFNADIRKKLGLEEDSAIVNTILTIRDAITGLFDVLVKGDFSKRFREAFQVEEDSPLVDYLFTLRERMQATFQEITGGLQAFVLAFIAGGYDITSSGFAGKLEELGLVLRRVFDNLRESVLVVWPAIQDLGKAVGVASQQIGVSVWDAFLVVLEAASKVILALAPTIASMAQWLSEHQKVVTGLVAAWTAWRVGMMAWKGVTAVLAAYKAVTLGVAAAQQAFAFGTYGVAAAQTTMSGRIAFATGQMWAQVTASMAWARQTAAAIAVNLRWQLMLFQQSARTAAAVIAGWVRMAAATVVQGAQMAAAAAATAARVVAGWVLMGVQSMIHAARMAAAWVIAMGPVGWVIAAVVGLVALIIANWDKVKKWTAAAWDWVVKKIKTAWEWVVNLFKRYHPVGIIISHWDRIKSATSAAWQWVRNTVSTAWSNITNAVSSGVSNVLGFVKSLPGKIASGLGNLGSLLYNKGRDMIQGLLNGATSLLSRIGSFFLDKVPAFIREPFKKALGIHSPSKVFAGYGRNIAEGVLVGVGGMRPQLDAAMRGLVAVPDVPSAFGDSPTAAQGAAAGGITQNIYPQPRQSEYEIATIASRQLAFGVRT